MGHGTQRVRRNMDSNCCRDLYDRHVARKIPWCNLFRAGTNLLPPACTVHRAGAVHPAQSDPVVQNLAPLDNAYPIGTQQPVDDLGLYLLSSRPSILRRQLPRRRAPPGWSNDFSGCQCPGTRQFNSLSDGGAASVRWTKQFRAEFAPSHQFACPTFQPVRRSTSHALPCRHCRSRALLCPPIPELLPRY